MDLTIPDEFRRSYRYSQEQFKMLEDLLLQAIDADVFDVQVPLRGEQQADELAAVPAEDVLEWLRAHDRNDELDEIVFHQSLLALVRDMCYYISEALECFGRGRNVVAYSLLRKPFKENLFYLEWMLVDKAAFLKSFRTGGPEMVEYGKAFRTEQDKRGIIRQAMEKCECEWLSDDLLYGLRYDKDAEYGFEGLWNRATHLITTSKQYRTETMSFNLVFSNADEWHSQLDHALFQLPILLMYATEVVTALFEMIAPPSEEALDTWSFRRRMGFFLWADHSHRVDLPGGCLDRLRSYLNESGVVLRCECGTPLMMNTKNALRFYYNYSLRCYACGGTTDLEKEPLVPTYSQSSDDSQASEMGSTKCPGRVENRD